MLEDLPDECAELWRTRQIGAVTGDIDAGQHNFAITVADQTLHVRDHRAHRHRARIAAAVWNDAEGAAVVAAVLHLDEGAGAAGETFDQMRRGFFDRHDVVDDRLRRIADIERRARVVPRRGVEFLGIAENAIGHGDKSLRLGLRSAAGDDDLCLRPLATERPDGLPRLTNRFRRNGAGIDDDRVA